MRTLNEVREALRQHAAAHGQQATTKLLQRVASCDTPGEVSEDDYDAVITATGMGTDSNNRPTAKGATRTVDTNAIWNKRTRRDARRLAPLTRRTMNRPAKMTPSTMTTAKSPHRAARFLPKNVSKQSAKSGMRRNKRRAPVIMVATMTSRTLLTYSEWLATRPGAGLAAYRSWIGREQARAERNGERVNLPEPCERERRHDVPTARNGQ